MRTLEEHKRNFLKRDIEYKLGKKQEDWNEYLTNRKLEHLKIKNLNNDDFQDYLLNQNVLPYLSETQKANINRDNNQLNSMGLFMGFTVPLTLASIYGVNKIMDHIKPSESPAGAIRESLIRNRYERTTNNMGESLSGYNSKRMPIADKHMTENTIGGLFPPYITADIESQDEYPYQPSLAQNMDDVLYPPY